MRLSVGNALHLGVITYLVVAGSAVRTGLQALYEGSGDLPASAACVIPAYFRMDSYFMQIEYRYMIQHVYSAIPHVCGCNLMMVDRADFIPAVKSLKDGKSRGLTLMASHGPSNEEQAAIREHANEARSKLVHIHLSDEGLSDSRSWYPDAKAVFRNYYSGYEELEQTGSYILDSLKGEGGSRHEGNTFWFPLGLGQTFIHTPLLLEDMAVRPLLWSWSGSTHGKPERDEMLRVLRASPLSELGHLGPVYGGFQEGDKYLIDTAYSTLLYTSKLIPIARGENAEQYRLWECIAAGAIPVALNRHRQRGLAHVDFLGFKLIWIDSWDQFPAAAMEVHTNITRLNEMREYQGHNLVLFKKVMHAVARRFAMELCGGGKTVDTATSVRA